MPSKPTNLDAQRILAVIEELIKKLTYLSMIDVKALENLKSEDGEATAAVLGPDLVSKIEQQIHLEMIFEKNHADPNGFSLPQDDTELSFAMREQLETLQKSTRELCRAVDSQEIVLALRGLQENKDSTLKNLASILHEMQGLIEKRLTTTVEEDNSRREILEQYRKRAELANRRKKDLERDLALVQADRDKSQAARKEQITKLKADLDDIRHTTEFKLKSLAEKYEQRGKEHKERFQKRETELLKQISEMEQANENLRNVAEKEEEKKRKEKRNKEIELQRLLLEYDEAMFEKAGERTHLEEMFEEEKKETVRLNEAFEKLEAENERKRQEREIEMARASIFEDHQDRRARLAQHVQSWWRGVKQREEFMKLKKAAKRKGKGKKK